MKTHIQSISQNKMISLVVLLMLQTLVSSEGNSLAADTSFADLAFVVDACHKVDCGTGVCTRTKNPTLPYYCQCPNGSNTILPCSLEGKCRCRQCRRVRERGLDSCSSNPCGQGICEVVTNLRHGYLCQCNDGTLSLTTCNGR